MPLTELQQIEQAITALEAQRGLLGDSVVETALGPLREKLAALQAYAPAEQRKQITVLFADISGFTSMAETMDAEELRDAINSLWMRLDRVIADHGGTIDKHIGDAVMALFGAPTAREDDPERAVRAALAMQAEIEDEKPRAEALSQFSALRMRIGIHTGLALLGAVGTMGEYTAMGDTVNLASRLEHAAPVGGILISHDTYRHVRGVFDVQPPTPIAVKGKAEPVQVYVVQGAKPRAFRVPTRGVEGIETRMIGREAELRQLQAAMSAVAAERTLRACTIVGEAGVGKSRLLYEFVSWVDLLPGQVRLFNGRAGQELGKLPYALVRDMLAARFEIQESDPAALARHKLEQGVVSFAGADRIEQAHFIGHLIGFDFSTSPHLRGIIEDASQVRSRAFHYAVQFFAAVARDGPAALFFEDIHWSDDGSLDLIEHLIRECRASPLLIVCLARRSLFERRAAWGEGQAAHVRVDLRALSPSDSRQLLTEILRKAPEVPATLQDLIVNRADGNPFYIEELIKVLIDDGVLVAGAEAWSVDLDRLAGVRVPPTLIGVLQARLDGLPAREREALQRASVVGRIFWDEAVERLGVAHQPSQERPRSKRRTKREHDGAGGDIRQLLGRLRGRELIFRRAATSFSTAEEYMFKHAILRDVTYESVLKRLRRTYHAQVAAWLIERSGERVGEYAALIGEHYERAAERGRAAEWYARAAKQAQDTYTLEAAISYYRKALAFLPAGTAHAARQVELYAGLGEVLRWQARHAEAADTFDAMRLAAEAAGDLVGQAHAWDGLARVQDAQGQYHAMLASASRAEDAARAAGSPAAAELAKVLLSKGWGLYRLGDTSAALALGEQALALNIALQASGEMSRSLGLLGSVYDKLGHHEQAISYTRQALEIAQQRGDRVAVVGMLNNLAETAWLLGEHQQAIALYREALAAAREIGYRYLEMIVLSNLGGAHVHLREHQAGESAVRQAIEIAESGGSKYPEAYCFLAEACLGQGRPADALAAARRALELGLAEQECIGAAWRALGMVAAALPAPIAIYERAYDAPACFAESARILRETREADELGRTLRVWAAYELERGDRARGAALRDEARLRDEEA
jgi:class 3 adenylate cyclase/tetratricopeptide (TPR) repeat protein